MVVVKKNGSLMEFKLSKSNGPPILLSLVKLLLNEVCCFPELAYADGINRGYLVAYCKSFVSIIERNR